MASKWPREPRENGACELITIVILVLVFSTPITDAINKIVAVKESCCEEKLGRAPKLYLLADAETCSNSTDGGVVLNATDGGTCCVDVDTCAANDECLSDCVYDVLGFSLAQFAPGPTGAFIEIACFIGVFFGLVICGLIGRYVDRRYAPKHETLTWAGIDSSYFLLFFLIPPFVTFFCVTLAANVGVQLVLDVAQLLFFVVLVVPIWLLCTPLALGSSVPSFRFVRHTHSREKKRLAAISLKKKSLSTPQALAKSLWGTLCGGQKAKDTQETFISYVGAVAKLFVRPSPIRWLTFTKSLAAVLYCAILELSGLMWFMLRLFAAATLCIFNPPKFREEYGFAVRQRERIRLMAYPDFWDSEIYARYAEEVGEAQSGAELASADFTKHVKEQIAAAEKKKKIKAGSQLAAVAEGGHAAISVLEEGGTAEEAASAAYAIGRDKAVKHVTSELKAKAGGPLATVATSGHAAISVLEEGGSVEEAAMSAAGKAVAIGRDKAVKHVTSELKAKAGGPLATVATSGHAVMVVLEEGGSAEEAAMSAAGKAVAIGRDKAVKHVTSELKAKARGPLAAVAESGYAAMAQEGGSAEKAAVSAASTAVEIGRAKAKELVTSELKDRLWKGELTPPVLDDLLSVLCEILGETLFLIIFFVKAAVLTESTLQAHYAETEGNSLTVGTLRAKRGSLRARTEPKDHARATEAAGAGAAATAGVAEAA